MLPSTPSTAAAIKTSPDTTGGVRTSTEDVTMAAQVPHQALRLQVCRFCKVCRFDEFAGCGFAGLMSLQLCVCILALTWLPAGWANNLCKRSAKSICKSSLLHRAFCKHSLQSTSSLHLCKELLQMLFAESSCKSAQASV